MKVAAIFKNKDFSSSSEESPGLACVVVAPHEPGNAAAALAVGEDDVHARSLSWLC